MGMTTNAAPTPITGGGISASNPLARVQNDEGYVAISNDRPVIDIHHSITNVVVPFW